jgi:hypothetical protein
MQNYEKKNKRKMFINLKNVIYLGTLSTSNKSLADVFDREN